MTKSQIDRLGKRLSKGHPTAEDLQQLDAYRRTFTKDFDAVVEKIRETLGSAEKQEYDFQVRSGPVGEWPQALRAREENYRRMMQEARRDLADSLRALQASLKEH